jgi:hypothetical protein
MQVFDIHDVVANITEKMYEGDIVSLEDICFKPFGGACAIESVAQYWQMDRSKYDAGNPSLQQCLAHWSTQCRRAFISAMVND